MISSAWAFHSGPTSPGNWDADSWALFLLACFAVALVVWIVETLKGDE